MSTTSNIFFILGVLYMEGGGGSQMVTLRASKF